MKRLNWGLIIETLVFYLYVFGVIGLFILSVIWRMLK